MNRIRYRLEHPRLGTSTNGIIPDGTTIKTTESVGAMLYSVPIEPGFSADELDRIIAETKEESN